MKSKYAVLTVVSALAMMLLAPLDVVASAKALGLHAFHFSGHFRSARHHRAQWPLYGYGGLYAAPSDIPDDLTTYTTPQTVVFVRAMPLALSCQHSQEIKTVPSEDGGTREIKITRC
jgi:hypothetical protein